MISNSTLAHYYALQLPPVDPQAPRALKDQRSHTTQFVTWLALRDAPVDEKLLIHYQRYLEQERQLQPGSIRAHLGAVRSWLRPLLRDETVRGDFVRLLPAHSPAAEQQLSELYNRLWAAIDPHATTLTRPQSEPTLAFCPTVPQIERLLESLWVDTLPYLRDATLIANLVFLGLRETELCALDVEDVRPWSDSRARVLVVPDRPGCTPRVIGLDDFPAVEDLNQLWIDQAQLTSGALFRGFHRYEVVSRRRLSPRGVERILSQHPIRVNGEVRVLRPLELRRFAARLLAQRGLSLEGLCAFLGVAQVQTVVGYLGGKLPPNSADAQPSLDRLNQALLRKLP